MDLYARVNILGGLSVRLPRGRLDDAIALDNDPVGRAKHWAAQGHLIDDMIESAGVPVQVAGGIRSEGEAQRLIEHGAWRIVMGTAAIENQNMVWDLCRENPDRIAVSLDVRPDEEIVTKGWTQNSGRYLEEVLIEMSSAGVASFLISEAGRDALAEPPNLQIMSESMATVEQPVIAAGGVRDLEDLRDLVRLESAGRRLGGVIVGREVTAGRFTIEEAKQVLVGGGPMRAPGGVMATTVRVGVSSLSESLNFYEGRLGFTAVRTPSKGVVTEVVESARGQRLELVEGETPPSGITFVVDDLERWGQHLGSLDIVMTVADHSIEIVDPDGLKLRFEQG